MDVVIKILDKAHRNYSEVSLFIEWLTQRQWIEEEKKKDYYEKYKLKFSSVIFLPHSHSLRQPAWWASSPTSTCSLTMASVFVAMRVSVQQKPIQLVIVHKVKFLTVIVTKEGTVFDYRWSSGQNPQGIELYESLEERRRVVTLKTTVWRGLTQTIFKSLEATETIRQRGHKPSELLALSHSDLIKSFEAASHDDPVPYLSFLWEPFTAPACREIIDRKEKTGL